jgi:hypothetical protein
MASRSGRQGNISPELKQLIEGGTATVEKQEASSPDEGCRICCRDEDHANLLLCEACDDEYHTYCLQPPLKNVPEDDWFCGRLLYREFMTLDVLRSTSFMILSSLDKTIIFVATQTIVNNYILSKMMMAWTALYPPCPLRILLVLGKSFGQLGGMDLDGGLPVFMSKSVRVPNMCTFNPVLICNASLFQSSAYSGGSTSIGPKKSGQTPSHLFL